MTRRALVVEGLHIAGGVVATVLVFMAGAWSYPPGRETVWLVGYATIAAVVVLGLPQLRRAWMLDRKHDD